MPLVDHGGRWHATIPKKGNRWIDMPDLALKKLADLLEYPKIPRDAAEAVRHALDRGSVPEAQGYVQKFMDDFPFDEIVAKEDERVWTDKDGNPVDQGPVGKIYEALQTFVDADPAAFETGSKEKEPADSAEPEAVVPDKAAGDQAAPDAPAEAAPAPVDNEFSKRLQATRDAIEALRPGLNEKQLEALDNALKEIDSLTADVMQANQGSDSGSSKPAEKDKPAAEEPKPAADPAPEAKPEPAKAEEAKSPSANLTMEDLEKQAKADGDLVLYHGGLPEGTTLDEIDLNREGTQQNKRGRSFGGFYLTDESSKSWSEKYAKERNGVMHGFAIDKNARIDDRGKEQIDRLSVEDRAKAAESFDVIMGKDLLGRTQYVILNKDVVKGVGETNINGDKATESKPEDKSGPKHRAEDPAEAPAEKPVNDMPQETPDGPAESDPADADAQSEIAGVAALKKAFEDGYSTSDESIWQGKRGSVEIGTLGDGTKVVRKVAPNEEEADKEALIGLVANVLGVDVATAKIDKTELVTHHIDGGTGNEWLRKQMNDGNPDAGPGGGKAEKLGRWKQDGIYEKKMVREMKGAKEIGLLDYLTNNPDRHAGNWMVRGDNEVVPIDHGNAKFTLDKFEREGKQLTWFNGSPFAKYWLGMQTGKYKEIKSMEPGKFWDEAELKSLRAKLAGLKGEFASRPEWHDAIMANIDNVLEHMK